MDFISLMFKTSNHFVVSRALYETMNCTIHEWKKLTSHHNGQTSQNLTDGQAPTLLCLKVSHLVLRRRCSRLLQDIHFRGASDMSPARTAEPHRAEGWRQGCPRAHGLWRGALTSRLNRGLSSALEPKAGLRGQGLRQFQPESGKDPGRWVGQALPDREGAGVVPGAAPPTPLPRTLRTGSSATSSENRFPSPTVAFLCAHLRPQMRGLLPRVRTRSVCGGDLRCSGWPG